MAEWKKVIVSGSTAELKHVTASAGIQITDIATTSTTTENVLVVDSLGNVKKATQATVAGAVATAPAYATTSIANSAPSPFNTSGTVLSGSLNSSVTYVNNGNINLSISGSTTGDFIAIQAVTKSLTAGNNLTLTDSGIGTANSTTIAAVTKSLTAGTNITLSDSGVGTANSTTITAVTKSLVGGDNVTVTLSGTNATIATFAAVTKSITGTSNQITVTAGSDGAVTLSTPQAINTSADVDFNSIDVKAITASGDISASGELQVSSIQMLSASVGLGSGGGIISASGLYIENITNLNGDTIIDGNLTYNGLNLIEDDIIVRSGSTIFGSGSNPDEITHTFTGSILVTGSFNIDGPIVSNETITATSFVGDGANITGIVASAVSLNTLTAGAGLAASAGNYNGSANTTFSVNVGTGLEIDSDTVKISDGGVGSTQLAAGVAGPGLAGGDGTQLSIDVSEFTEVTPTSGDAFLTLDSDNSTEQLTTVDALATLLAGDGLGAASGVMKVDVSDFAGTGLTDDGAENLKLDINEFSDVTPANGDHFLTLDSDGSTHQLTTTTAYATFLAGTGITATNGVLSADISSLGSLAASALDLNSVMIGNSGSLQLGATHSAFIGLTDLDMTADNHTIFDTIGSNTLTIGAASTTVEIAGNFKVSGTTTIINTETLQVDDNFIDLNSNLSGSADEPSQDAGISIKRGNQADANLYWEETNNRWAISDTNMNTTATDAVVSQFLATVATAGSNPGSDPSYGTDAASRSGHIHVNTTTNDIWIYA